MVKGADVKTGIRINPRGKRKYGAQWKSPAQKEVWKKRKADPVYPTGGEERNVGAMGAELCIRLRIPFRLIGDDMRGYWYEGRYIVGFYHSTRTAMVWEGGQWYTHNYLRWGQDQFDSEVIRKLEPLVMDSRDMTRLRRWGIAGVAVGMNG